MTALVTFDRLRSQDWQRARVLRLMMLADNPSGYLERLADAAVLGDDEWRSRVEWLSRGGSFFAVLDDRDVGFVATTLDDDPDALIHATYVVPHVRGQPHRIARGMLDRGHAWATTDAARIGTRLWVRSDNRAAYHCYVACGYRVTGLTRPYVLDPAYTELELRRHDGSAPRG